MPDEDTDVAADFFHAIGQQLKLLRERAGLTLVRDSKLPSNPHLTFSSPHWAEFVRSAASWPACPTASE
jgi:hypothetical protein